jgi:hypothetical protein
MRRENNGEDRGVASHQSLVSSWRLHDCHGPSREKGSRGHNGRRPVDFLTQMQGEIEELKERRRLAG